MQEESALLAVQWRAVFPSMSTAVKSISAAVRVREKDAIVTHFSILDTPKIGWLSLQ